MIPVFMALAAAQAVAGASYEETQYRACIDHVRKAPEEALVRAEDWRMRGGSIFARLCMGLAYSALERWQPAAIAFEQAAREAEVKGDARRADFWVQSGNSWLAANDGAKARAAFDAALGTGQLSPAMRGEVYLDRSRASVAISDLAAARADLDKGLELVPGDAFGWYLSAALALKEEGTARARHDIAKAVELAPDDADVLYLAGNVAGTTGDTVAARAFYKRAIAAAPSSPAGKFAEAALAANSGEAPEAAPAPAPKG